jgi:hypothetical protein
MHPSSSGPTLKKYFRQRPITEDVNVLKFFKLFYLKRLFYLIYLKGPILDSKILKVKWSQYGLKRRTWF